MALLPLFLSFHLLFPFGFASRWNFPGSARCANLGLPRFKTLPLLIRQFQGVHRPRGTMSAHSNSLLYEASAIFASNPGAVDGQLSPNVGGCGRRILHRPN